MRYYFAPMEGINGYLYRRIHAHLFPGIDKYFMPFLVPHVKRSFNSKELKEIAPENNKGLYAVPQIMTNKAEDFISTAKKLRDLGYDEVNLNLGCPSKTVVSKGRGSGFLAYPKELERFLDEIFEKLDMKISVKTRAGVEEEEEFLTLLDIYNRFPMEELIVHPRLQTDYYKKPVRFSVFLQASAASRNPLCYNGDLIYAQDIERFAREFPQVDRVMIGRGLLRNPGLVRKAAQGIVLDKETLREYHDQIYEAYQEVLYGDRNILFRMKELWCFMGSLFEDPKKYIKKIQKSQRLSEYEQAVEGLFMQREFEGKMRR